MKGIGHLTFLPGLAKPVTAKNLGVDGTYLFEILIEIERGEDETDEFLPV